MSIGRIDMAHRHLAAAPGAAWQALTSAEAWLAWLPPEGARGEIERFDLRRGGTYRLALTWQGRLGDPPRQTDHVDGEFVELCPGARLVHLMRFNCPQPDGGGEMRLVWSLRPSDGGTSVTFRAENVPKGISAGAHRQSMRRALAELAAYLA